jgi:poly-gamma-glutamate synthesis protein (capsule biosynthesis protein)
VKNITKSLLAFLLLALWAASGRAQEGPVYLEIAPPRSVPLEALIPSEEATSWDESASLFYFPLYESPEDFVKAMEQVKSQEPSQKLVSGVIVPYTPLASDLIARAFAYAKGGAYKRIIILSLDRISISETPAAVPEKSFATCLGPVPLDEEAAKALTGNPLFSASSLFSSEHSVQGFLPLVAAYFPGAKVLPVALIPDSKPDSWQEIKKALWPFIDEGTLVVQSTEFSHHLTIEEAEERDQESLAVLRAMDPEGVLTLNQSQNVDSKAALHIQMSIQKDLGAKLVILARAGVCDYLISPCYHADDQTTYIVVAYVRPAKSTPAAP